MEIIKLLKDYSDKDNNEIFAEFLSQKLPCGGICKEVIKNKDFMIAYLKPVNDFVIFTTALPYTNCSSSS